MKPKWTPIKVRLGQIQAWEGNPRMSTKAQAQRIIQSERKFGQPVPFLVAPENNGRFLLYDGHQRLSAWFTVYGADYKMDAMVSDRPLTDEEHKELIITLHTGATGSWDWNALSGWSAGDLQEWGMNTDALKGWNNDANNLKELLNAEAAEPVDAEPQIDRAAELQEKWGTKTGDLWKLGEHRLLIGDCTVRENVERLMGGKLADCVITDPPFPNNSEIMHEQILDIPKAFENIRIYCKGKMLWFWDNITEPPFSEKVVARHVWHKTNGWQAGHWEAINVYTGKDERLESIVYSFPNVGVVRRDDVGNHLTPKPPKLIQELFEKDNLIVDIFAGSGTTIIAAHNLNRRCYAMEISEKYGAVILERFYTATGITPELVE